MPRKRGKMRILFMPDKENYFASRFAPALCEEIRGRGHEIAVLGETVFVDTEIEQSDSYDLFCVTSNSGISALVCGAVLEYKGVTGVNSIRSVMLSMNKYLVNMILRDNGVQVPRVFLYGTKSGILEHSKSLHFPLVAKPNTGRYGKQVILANTWAELKQKVVDYSDVEIYLVQEFVGKANGKVGKLYLIGDQAFLIERIGSQFGYTGSEELITQVRPVPSSFRALGLKCSELLGLSLCVVDLIEYEKGKFYVVDVSDFPTYRGVPAAEKKVADFLLSRCEVAKRNGGHLHGRDQDPKLGPPKRIDAKKT